MSARSFRLVLGFLRSRDVVPPQVVLTATSIDALLGDYRAYLACERGLVASTITGYVASARWFLTATGTASWSACAVSGGRSG